jgi:acetyl esterase/lipase
VLKASTRVTPKLMPALPAFVKRALTGYRTVTIDGNTLDPTLQVFLAGLRCSGVPGIVVDDDVAVSRTVMRDTCMGLGGPVRPVEVTALSVPGPAGAIPVRHYRAGDTPSALVFFHGGGYTLGDLDGYDALCRRLCHDAQTQVFSVDYRLAPEHPAPAAVDDSCAAYAWVTEHAAEFGVPADRIAVGGDSAGGGLAAVVAQWAKSSPVPAPVLQLLLYPVTDLGAQTRSRTLFADGFVLTGHDMAVFRDAYLADSPLTVDDPRVSPLLADDVAGLAPALVVTAGFDPLRDEGDLYAAALERAGVPVDLRRMGSMVHGFMNFAGLGGGVERSVADITSALRAHLRRG